MGKTNTTNVVMKKKPIPASFKRSARRRQEFLQKKLYSISNRFCQCFSYIIDRVEELFKKKICHKRR